MDALTEHLSSYVAGLAYDDIPADAVHGMKVRLVDSIGCAIGGQDGEPVAVARALA
ncbi:MAG: MmgE/PrpD family protein, partial [Chloroflexi bacterium]|nr:MmgE/PrpD family protein [Chloroflexota bacterium]